MEAKEEGAEDAVQAVGDAVDVANFIAVMGWNWKLMNFCVGLFGLEEDMGVKVPFVAVFPEGDAAEKPGVVSAVAGMEFGHGEAA